MPFSVHIVRLALLAYMESAPTRLTLIPVKDSWYSIHCLRRTPSLNTSKLWCSMNDMPSICMLWPLHQTLHACFPFPWQWDVDRDGRCWRYGAWLPYRRIVLTVGGIPHAQRTAAFLVLPTDRCKDCTIYADDSIGKGVWTGASGVFSWACAWTRLFACAAWRMQAWPCQYYYTFFSEYALKGVYTRRPAECEANGNTPRAAWYP